MGKNVNSKWQIFAWSDDLGETLMYHNLAKVINTTFTFLCLLYLNNTCNWYDQNDPFCITLISLLIPVGGGTYSFQAI